MKLPSLFPLELQLGIVAGVATPALADRVALLSVDMTQRQLLEALRSQHHVGWGAETLRKTVAAMADALSPVRHQVQANERCTSDGKRVISKPARHYGSSLERELKK